MKKDREKSILKLDAFAAKILNTATFENRSIWQRFYEAHDYFAEIIAVNPSTNIVYVSDSKNIILYEIVG